MPLSTSSSSPSSRLPDRPFGRCWFVAAIVFAVLLGAMELALRGAGHRPSVLDSKTLWAMHRHRLAEPESPSYIAILGGSRSQVGLDPAVLKAALPVKSVVMLAVDGSSCLPVLDDLAYQSEFSGLVIVDFAASLSRPRASELQEQWADDYHLSLRSGAWINAYLNQSIASWLQQRFVGCSGQRLDLHVRHLLGSGRLAPRSYISMRASRFRQADYYSQGASWVRSYRARRVARIKGSRDLPPQAKRHQWDAMLSRLTDAVETIRRQGCETVFVRMPTTDEHWDIDEARYPRADFWDELAVRGFNTIHFRDYPDLRKYDCPDTSHLNYDNAASFSRSLAQILMQRGLLPSG